MSVQEYFGITAELNKDKPQNVAATLRVIANEIETAPKNRRYDISLDTIEYVVGNSDGPEMAKEDSLKDLKYNDLRSLAAKNGINLGPSPSENELRKALKGNV